MRQIKETAIWARLPDGAATERFARLALESQFRFDLPE
jgi:hypothetical protein